MIDNLMISGISFGRNLLGIILKPYETYRRIVGEGSLWELTYIGAILAFYFALATAVKIATFRPYILTRQFLVLALASGVTFMGVIGLIWIIGKMIKSEIKLKGLVLGWAYTLIPTTLWFLSTSVLYVLLPPPRTTRPEGIVFSILYLVFSVTLLSWKATLAYLTLRFAMKLDLARILLVGILAAPALAVYSLLMYRWGIFRIPFI